MEKVLLGCPGKVNNSYLLAWWSRVQTFNTLGDKLQQLVAVTKLLHVYWRILGKIAVATIEFCCCNKLDKLIQSDLIFCDLLQQQNSDKELHSTPCAPKLWNLLPLHLCKSPSLTGFKKGLKTYIFGQFFESGSLFL